MATFPIPEAPAHGSSISANWGRRVVDCLRRLRPVAGMGVRMDFTPNGTVYMAEGGTKQASSPSELRPFDVRWMANGKDSGEWQIYLPLGCVKVKPRNVGGETYPCLCVNDKAKDADGKEIHGWYKVDDPDGSEGLIETIGGTAYQSFPVYVLAKPWPRFKVSCDRKGYEAVAGCVAVASLDIAKKGGETSRKGVRTSDSPVEVDDSDANADSLFNIVYEFEEGSLYKKESQPQLKVVNRLFAGGRTVVQEDGEDEDLFNADEVWLVIDHDGSADELKIRVTQSDEGSDGKKTSIPLYRLEDGVVKKDTRALLDRVRYYDT